MNRAIPQSRQSQFLPPVVNHSKAIPLARRTGSIPTDNTNSAPLVVEDASTQAPEDISTAKVKRARRQNQRVEQTIPLEKLRWITVRQASIRYPFMTEKAWRHKIAQAEAYRNYPQLSRKKQDGFIDCVVRIPGQRKIVIDTEKYELYLLASNQKTEAPTNSRGGAK